MAWRRPTATSSPSTTASPTGCTRRTESCSTTRASAAALEFVTRKITWHAAALKLGLIDRLELGNLDARRDWGYAKDYVEAMWLMLQQDEAEDYVIATGVAHSVHDCLEVAFDQAGIEIDGRVVIDDSLRRPAEVDHLIGDASKAKAQLGWEPRTSFEQLIRLMVDADLRQLSG